MVKKGQVFKKYSAEFKIRVIMDMCENRLGYRETARKYDLVRQSEASAAAMLHRWERIFLEEGAEGLMKERRGRACSTSGTLRYGELFRTIKGRDVLWRKIRKR